MSGLRLDLLGRKRFLDIEFSVDNTDELEIAIETANGSNCACTWLTREEGQQLLDLLKSWLS